MEKEILSQYTDMVEEITEIQERMKRYEKEIVQIENRLLEIEAGETVIDKVMGGEGGIQGFKIEGVPSAEYHRKKSLMLSKKQYLERSTYRLMDLMEDLVDTTNKVDEYIDSIEDSHLRRIIRYRFLDSLTWNEVADKMGGGNTADSVKQAFSRYIRGGQDD